MLAIGMSVGGVNGIGPIGDSVPVLIVYVLSVADDLYSRIVEMLHSHITAHIIVNEATIVSAGTCEASADGNAAKANGKLTKSYGANWYDSDLAIGLATSEE